MQKYILREEEIIYGRISCGSSIFKPYGITEGKKCKSLWLGGRREYCCGGVSRAACGGGCGKRALVCRSLADGSKCKADKQRNAG